MSVNIKFQQALEAAQTLGKFLKKNLSPLGNPCSKNTDQVLQALHQSIGDSGYTKRLASRLTYFADASKREEERSIKEKNLAEEQSKIKSGIEMLLKRLQDINGISSISITLTLEPNKINYDGINKHHSLNIEVSPVRHINIDFKDGKQLVFTGLGIFGSDKKRNKRFESVYINLDQSLGLNIPRELKEIAGHGQKFTKEVKNLKDLIKSRLLEVILETNNSNPNNVNWVYGS
jgi:hypothetical protein